MLAQFVKVYRYHKLCRNVHYHNSCGNASGISPSYKGCGNTVCNFPNQVQECSRIYFTNDSCRTAELSMTQNPRNCFWCINLKQI